jgi:anti-anti-sigma factor
MTLRFTTTTQGDIVTLAVSGQIDASNATEFSRAIAEAFGHGTRLVIDLTAVDLLVSAGVSVLYDYVDRHPQLVIRAGSIIALVLAITGLDEHLSVQAT